MDDNELERTHAIFEASGLRGGVENRPARRLYGCVNVVRALTATMDRGYERVIRMDSDLTLSPYFIKQMLAASDWTCNPCQSDIICQYPLAKKWRFSRTLVRSHQSTGTNLVLTSSQWKMIQPMVTEYVETFMDGNHANRDNAACRKWFADRAWKIAQDPHRTAYQSGRVGTSVDSTIFFALLCNGFNVHSTVVNRAIHSIEPGQNLTTPDEDRLYASTRLDVLDEDATRVDFKFLDEEPDI